jgi:hypothetical protein
MRKCMTVMVLLGVGSLVLAQDKGKDKDKDKGPKDRGTPAVIVKVDVKNMVLTLRVLDKEEDYKATKETKFTGPRGGKADIKDKRLKPGARIRIVADGKTLREVHIGYAEPKKDKGKKDKKDKDKKDKDKKDK